MEYVKLNQIADILNGYNFKSSNYVEKGIRVIRITNVQQGYLEDKDPVYYPYLSEINKYMLKENDLLMSLTGNVGRVGLISNELLPAGLNQRVACIRCKNPDFSTKYLFYYFNNEIFRKNAINNSNGVAQLNLSTEWLKNVKIPIYSKDEQQKIIRQLDNIVVSIDNKKKEIEILDNLIKSQFIEMFGDINNCHFKYPLDNFGKKVIFDTKMTTDFSKYGNLIYVGVENIEKNSGNLVNLTYVKDNELKSGKYLFNEQHIIYSKIRPNLNKVALPTFEGLTSADSYPILVNDDMNKYYVTYVLRSFNYLQYADKVSRRANMPKINKEQMSNYMIMVPPKTLQDQFAAIVEQIDKSKYILQKQIDALQELLDSKMEEFFG